MVMSKMPMAVVISKTVTIEKSHCQLIASFDGFDGESIKYPSTCVFMLKSLSIQNLYLIFADYSIDCILPKINLLAIFDMLW